MRTRSALVLAATTAAATFAALTLTASAGASHSWGDYHWARTANPFTLITGDNVDGNWDGYLDTAVSDWSASSVMDLFKRSPGATTGRQCKASAGTIQVCNAGYGRNGWLGLASIWITDSTHITQGTAKMNDTYFKLAQYNTPDEKRHVMCQEIGHTFGLGHTSEDGTVNDTCMDYSTSPTSTHPNQHDYDLLDEIYAHFDSGTTIKTTSASSPSVGDDRSSWGREVHWAADGSHSAFVRDFGGGNLVVTHVIWALDSQAAARG